MFLAVKFDILNLDDNPIKIDTGKQIVKRRALDSTKCIKIGYGDDITKNIVKYNNLIKWNLPEYLDNGYECRAIINEVFYNEEFCDNRLFDFYRI